MVGTGLGTKYMGMCGVGGKYVWVLVGLVNIWHAMQASQAHISSGASVNRYSIVPGNLGCGNFNQVQCHLNS